MALLEKSHDAPTHLPSADELLTMRRSGALVLFPDEVSSVEGQPVAGFREGTQELRVGAKRIGLDVELVVPEGAKPGHYSEHAADWVLPLVLSMPTAVVATLIANQLQVWIDRWRDTGASRMPIARYREVVIDETQGRTAIKEIEGPADEILAWVRERSEIHCGDDEPRPAPAELDWAWPARD